MLSSFPSNVHLRDETYCIVLCIRLRRILCACPHVLKGDSESTALPPPPPQAAALAACIAPTSGVYFLDLRLFFFSVVPCASSHPTRLTDSTDRRHAQATSPAHRRKCRKLQSKVSYTHVREKKALKIKRTRCIWNRKVHFSQAKHNFCSVIINCPFLKEKSVQSIRQVAFARSYPQIV
jgi:hypothetical protein